MSDQGKRRGPRTRTRTRIRAVTFDVGGTLIEPWPSVGHIYADEAARHGMPSFPAETLNRKFAQAWRALKNFGYTRPEWAALVDATFQGLTPTPPSRTFFGPLYSRFARPDAWRVFPDVVPTLRRLQVLGVRLGIVSNWDRRLRPLLRELQLHSYFHTLVVSVDAGVCKPSAEIFRMAARRLRLPPEAILHVGDSLELDARAARRAGLRSLWLRRASRRPAAGEIGSLEGVAAELDLTN